MNRALYIGLTAILTSVAAVGGYLFGRRTEAIQTETVPVALITSRLGEHSIAHEPGFIWLTRQKQPR